MAGLTGTPTTRPPRLNAQYIVDFPRTGRLIFAFVLQHIAAVRYQFIEEFARLVRLIQQMLWRHAQHFDNFVHLINFIAARKQWFTGMHFDEYTAQ